MSRVTENTDENTDRVCALGTIKAGTSFRFAEVDFNRALDEDLFYTMSNEPLRDNRAKIVNLVTGEILIRDTDRLIVEHAMSIRATR